MLVTCIVHEVTSIGNRLHPSCRACVVITTVPFGGVNNDSLIFTTIFFYLRLFAIRILPLQKNGNRTTMIQQGFKLV